MLSLSVARLAFALSCAAFIQTGLHAQSAATAPTSARPVVRIGTAREALMQRGVVERVTPDSLVVRLDSAGVVRSYARAEVTQFLVRTGRIPVTEQRRDRALAVTKGGLVVSGVFAGLSGIGCLANQSQAPGDINPCRLMYTGAFLGVVATIVGATVSYAWPAKETDRWEAAAPTAWQLSVAPTRGAAGGSGVAVGLRRGF